MKKTKFRVYLILSVLWTVIVFLQSCLPGSASATESGLVLKLVHMVLPNMSEYTLRKIAHFTEFAMLGFFLTGAFWNAKKFLMIKPMFLGLLAALCDETIQIYAAGRSSSVTDVWIDAAGVAFGTIFLWVICKVKQK